MGKKIKVFNRTTHDVGVYFMDGVRTHNFKPNTYIMVDEDEIYNWNGSTNLFKYKHLCVDDPDVLANMFITPEDAHVDTDAEIVTKLKSSLASLRKYLPTIQQLHEKNRVRDIARTMDLTTSKIKLIEDTLGVTVYDNDKS